MLNKILVYLNLQNKMAIFIVIVLFELVVGFLVGIAAYVIALLTMPWLSDLQRKAIIPIFLLLYGLGGLYIAIAYAIKNK